MMLRKTLHVCIEFSDREIRFLWYKPGERDSAVFDVLPLSPGIIEKGTVLQPLELTRALESTLKQQQVTARVKAKIALRMPNGFVRDYSLPWVPHRERKKLIAYLADEEIPIRESERAFDYWIREEKKERLQVVLMGMREAQLLPYLTSLEGAGYEVCATGFVAVAWAQACAFSSGGYYLLIENEVNQDIQEIILHFYHELTPVSSKVLRYATHGTSLEERESECQRVLLHFFNAHEGAHLQSIVLDKGEEVREVGRMVQDVHRRQKGTEVQIVTLEERLAARGIWQDSISPDEKVRSDKSLTPLLAVWGMAGEKEPGHPNNLLREKEQRLEQSRKSWIAVLLFLTVSLAGWNIYNQLDQEIAGLEKEALHLQSLHEKRINGIAQKDKQAEEWNYLLKHPTTAGKELVKLQSLPGQELRFLRLEYKDQALFIQGTASQSATVQDLLRQIQSLGWKNAKLVSYHQADIKDSKAHIEFALTATSK